MVEVPKGWKYGKWSDVLCGFTSGATPYRGIPEYYCGKIKWVSSGELNYDYITDTVEHITDKAIKDTSLSTHPSGTFLMAITGLEAEGTRGSCGILATDATTNQSCMAIYGTDKMDIGFLFYYYIANGHMLAFKYCQGTKQQSYTAKLVKELPILYPESVAEQCAITSALSDVDKYIRSLENLIVKKRAIKQGAMQELLTGKRRLPGFEGDWVEKPLCEIADNIIMGQSPDSQYYNIKRIGLPLVQGNADIKDRVTIMRFFTSVITKQCNKDDFIMTVRAPVGNVAKADFECCLGRGVCAIKGNDYIYQLLIYFEPGWEAMSTGSTFDSISGNELREVKFNLPASKKEQAAIATLLSDMDAEIDALTAKLEKARQIKQGMMSELLTGRIRLIQEETDNGENKRNGAEDAKPCNCLVPGQSNSWV